jgi:hypothetical protein
LFVGTGVELIVNIIVGSIDTGWESMTTIDVGIGVGVGVSTTVGCTEVQPEKITAIIINVIYKSFCVILYNLFL